MHGAAARTTKPPRVWAVRCKKLGWTAAGAFLGVGLFLFWLVQIATIFIKERGF